MNKGLKKIYSYFSEGDKRTILAKKNILQTFLIRIFSIPISFLIIPLTIDYVSTDSYGIWITISSMVAWMSFFDIGINGGLRNKLTESIAADKDILAKKYISTTYAMLTIISVTILLIFVVINYFLDWSIILNTTSELSDELKKVTLVVFGYFSIKLVFSTINTILISCQLPAEASFRGLIEQTSSLLVIYLLTKYTPGSLLNLALGLCIPPLLVLLYFNFSLFTGKLKKLAPSISHVDFSLRKDLMSVGFKFFIIQIAGIIQFQTANFIILQSFGPRDVTNYNIVFKYFSILTMIMSLLVTPVWSAVTDAYAKNELRWIVRIEKKYRNIAFGIIGLGLLMLVLSPNIYELWLGKKIRISFYTSLWMFTFTSLGLLGSIYCNILNGISALDIQFKASVVSPFLFIFTCYILINYLKFGIDSVIIASIIANFNGFILAPLQFRQIFIQKNNI